MVRRLVTVVAALLALPALLAAQTPKAANAGAVHGRAVQVQGEVVRPAEAARSVGDVDHNQAEGDKAENHKDAQEGPDVDEGPSAKEGLEANEGADVHEGPDVEEGPNAAEQAQGEQEHEDTDAQPAPPGLGRNSRIGRHRP